MDATKIGLTIILGIVAGILGGAMGTSGALTIIPGLLLLELVPNFFGNKWSKRVNYFQNSFKEHFG